MVGGLWVQHGVVTIVTMGEGDESLVDDAVSPFFLDHFDSVCRVEGKEGREERG